MRKAREQQKSPYMPDVQAALAARARGGDRRAYAEIVESCVSLVKWWARAYWQRWPALSFEELVQDGILGLCEAVQHFNPESGARFSYYASFWIKKHILGRFDQERRRGFRGGMMTDQQIPLVDLVEVAEDALIDDTAPCPEAATVMSHGLARLPKAIARCSAIERAVLRRRYSGKDTVTYREVGEALGVSPSGAQQIEARAISRLREVYGEC